MPPYDLSVVNVYSRMNKRVILGLLIYRYKASDCLLAITIFILTVQMKIGQTANKLTLIY